MASRVRLLLALGVFILADTWAIRAQCIAPQGGGNDQNWINAQFVGGRTVLELCPFSTYVIASPIRFALPNQELRTSGLPSDTSRAQILVASSDGTAIVGLNLSGVKVRNVRIDAGGSGSSKGAPLIEFGGSATDQVVDFVQASRPRGWTALHVWEGAGLTCARATITNNTIGPSGLGYPTAGEWADGISVACANSLVANNVVTDATDGGIVIFGSPGTRVAGNVIRASTRVMFGGINLVDYGPWSGNFRGVIVENNLIDAAGAQIQIAIAMGYPTWWCDFSGNNDGAIVRNNSLSGAFMGYGYSVAGVTNWTATGNTSSATHSGAAIACDGSPTGIPPSAFLRNTATSTGTFQVEFQPANLHGLPGHIGPPTPRALQPTSALPPEQSSATLSWQGGGGTSFFRIVANDLTDPSVRDPRNSCSGSYLCIDQLSSTSISLPVTAGHSYTWSVEPSYLFNGSRVRGTPASASFSVTAAIDNAVFVRQTPPPNGIAPGSLATVSVTFRNSGTTTWSEASMFRLGSQNPQDNQTWAVGRVLLNAGEQIVPGHEKAFSFTVRAPSSTGPANFQWRMVHEAVRWFGDFSPNVSVYVGCQTPIAAVPGSFPADTIWVDDQLPGGAIVAGPWTWDAAQRASGFQSNTEPAAAGMHQHFFYGASQTLAVAAGDKLSGYVLLDPCNPPKELMLQWNDGSWEHRAFWGQDQIGWGVPGTSSRLWMGALPPAGQWVRLEVPASWVALEGHTLNGMAFTLSDGKAWFDRAGLLRAPAVCLHSPTNLYFEGYPSRNLVWAPPDNLTANDQVSYTLFVYGVSAGTSCSTGCNFSVGAPYWYTIGPSILPGTYRWTLRAVSVSRCYEATVNGANFVLGSP